GLGRAKRLQDAPAGAHAAAVPRDAGLPACGGERSRSRQAVRHGAEHRGTELRPGGRPQQEGRRAGRRNGGPRGPGEALRGARGMTGAGDVMAHRAGTVAIVGRPNVGKSTLLNALVGTKVAIVTPKPQTTRTRVVGIRTTPAGQAVFVDTPGIHAARSTLNRRMVETARRTLEDVDATILVLDAGAGITAADRELARELATGRLPVVVVLNKMDRLPRAQLLP